MQPERHQETLTPRASSALLEHVDAIAEVVRCEADVAERDRRLGPETVHCLRTSRLARMTLPAELGGLGLSLGETFGVVEAMARVDGSAGWNLNIGVNAMGIALGLGGDAREEILGDHDLLGAGTLNFLAIRCRQVTGGYRFNGRATFLSGSSYADWFMLGGLLVGDDGPRFGVDSMPIIVKGVIRPDQIELDDTWHVSGLRATASNDASIDDLFIPDRDISAMDHPSIAPHDPAASVPLFHRFGPGVASVGIGVAQGCLDAFAAVAVDKVPLGGAEPLRLRPDVQAAVGRAMGCLDGARGHLRCGVERCRAKCSARDHRDRGAAARCAPECRERRRASGPRDEPARRRRRLRGVVRDQRDRTPLARTHAVSRHVAVSPRQYAAIGQSALGVPARPPIL